MPVIWSLKKTCSNFHKIAYPMFFLWVNLNGLDIIHLFGWIKFKLFENGILNHPSIVCIYSVSSIAIAACILDEEFLERIMTLEDI